MNWLRRILRKGKKKRAGFTLVELMIVVIVVAILAAAAIPIYWWAMARAYSSEARALLGGIRSVGQIFYAEHGRFWTISPPAGTDPTVPIFTNDTTLYTSVGIKADNNRYWHAEQLTWHEVKPAWTDSSGVVVGTGLGPWVLANGSVGAAPHEPVAGINKIRVAIGLDTGEFLVSYDGGIAESWNVE